MLRGGPTNNQTQAKFAPILPRKRKTAEEANTPVLRLRCGALYIYNSLARILLCT
jgi:hypothetical protein